MLVATNLSLVSPASPEFRFAPLSAFRGSRHISSVEDGDKKSDKWNIQRATPFPVQWSFCVPQALACCAAHSVVINCGISLVFSAILLPQLMDANSQLRITNEDASWIASLVTIATPVGALLIGPIMDKFGRLRGCKFCAFTMCVSWVLMAVSNSVPMLCFSRTLCGITTGISTVAMVYVSETSHPRVRSALLCLNSVFFSLGILATCVSGSWMTWRNTAICSAILSAFQFFLFWLLPESPHWLAVVSKGDENSKHWENAESSLRWLYRNDLIAHQEIEFMKKNLENVKTMKRLSLLESLKCLHQRSILKPFFILIGIFIFQQFSGAYILIFYAVHLFRKVGGKLGSSIDALQALIIMGAIRFIMSCIVSVISHKIGRRPLLMASYLGMSVSSLVLGICLYSVPPNIQANLFDENPNQGQLLPIVCILLFVCFSALGVLVIPWTLPVELLPVQVRGIGGGIMVSWAYFLMFVTVKNFPDVIDLIGISYVFFILFLVCLVGLVYIYLLLPETLGKSFSEIQKIFE